MGALLQDGPQFKYEGELLLGEGKNTVFKVNTKKCEHAVLAGIYLELYHRVFCLISAEVKPKQLQCCIFHHLQQQSTISIFSTIR